ncbi:hypothetical protein BBO99_00005955 [Phytophthora kernoviae]|uniref:Peptidase S74 domain-containing protein n=2 Tax=Phytophthora kernoviae TaxID=325452 RepID=A0A3R7GHN9_9STRA|nr:hypothetical protein G195_007109 [Phytophthora kernoviae 00238/432]KAG2521971.1 hypothetical protein JM16_005910 [Phytophthora kernoviae]KAG2523535.1 hypothetical protein JM18_005759 [Phytophthora kernoviae]RLN02220.1 hypothetical protein BBI17_006017 [Phytophthora kernoviae]RLN78460.1 hypothetical protein BBO99_00005955 [Phytophthora kernoviae]
MALMTAPSGTKGTSGAIVINTGDTTSGDSGELSLYSGQGLKGKGGFIALSVGNNTENQGGDVTVQAGLALHKFTGGSVIITTGASLRSTSGDLVLQTPNSGPDGGSGSFALTTGKALATDSGSMSFVTGVAKKGHGGSVLVSVGRLPRWEELSRFRQALEQAQIRATVVMVVVFKFAAAMAWVGKPARTTEEWFTSREVVKVLTAPQAVEEKVALSILLVAKLEAKLTVTMVGQLTFRVVGQTKELVVRFPLLLVVRIIIRVGTWNFAVPTLRTMEPVGRSRSKPLHKEIQD